MKFKLTATLTHKSWPTPMHKELFYEGDSLDSVVNTFETLEQHKYNLKKHRRTAFKDVNGVKHKWSIAEINAADIN